MGLHSSYQDRCGKFLFNRFYWFSKKITFKKSFLQLSRLPFNSNCPAGYVVAIIFQWILCICADLILTIVDTIGIATYLFVTAITKDIKCILKAIQGHSKNRTECKHIYKKFIEFVNLHAALKQLSGVCETCGSWKGFEVQDFSLFFNPQNCDQLFGDFPTISNLSLSEQHFFNMLCAVAHSNGTSCV